MAKLEKVRLFARLETGLGLKAYDLEVPLKRAAYIKAFRDGYIHAKKENDANRDNVYEALKAFEEGDLDSTRCGCSPVCFCTEEGNKSSKM